jgi:hypothetical protein
MEKLVGSDPFLARILTVFEGRVSPEPSSEQLMQMEADAQERYEKRIPPGFADIKSKDMPGACGDYIAWRQLMEISRTEGKDIILAIDDLKEDWWFIERGRTVGPRPELLEEFNRVTERRVYIYNSENFLRAAKRFIAADIRDDVIEEVTQRLASRRETQRVSQDKPVASEAAAAGAPRAMHSVDEKLVADVKPVMSASSEEDKPRV